MQQTTHLGLDKPEIGVDRASINIINENMDTLDSAIYDLQQSDSDKQDKLTAGANITINPTTNEISATDTTYTDMVGATSLADGAAGLAPKPNAGDEDKFLKGDGTWGTPSGGGGSSTLSGLDDVTITSPTEGQTLVYDSTNQEWVNGASSGGTTVVPNPVGEPTDELETLQIGNTIFSISGSSGGGSTAKRTVLYSGTEIETGVIELSDDISNYDIIEVVLGFTGTADKAKGSCYISAEWLLNNCSYTQNPTNAIVHWLPSLFDNTYTRIIMGNTNNKLQAFDRVGQAVTEVAGIKFGSGGGKGSGDGYSSTKIWDYVDDNNGTIPYGTYSVTLNDDINNYDMIIAELVSIAGDLNESNWRGTNLFYIDVNSVNNSLESNYINYTTYGDRSARYHIEDTTFAIVTNSGNDRAGLVRVWGIKYGGLYTEDISKGIWTSLVSTTTTSSATAIPDGTTHLVLTSEMGGSANVVAIESIADIEKLMNESQLSTWGMGYEWADTSGNHTNIAMSVSNGEVTIKSGYNTVTATLYAVKATKPRIVQPEMQSISLGDDTTSRTFTLREAPNKVSMQGYTSGDGGWYESGWFIWGEPFMVLHGAQGSVATGGYVGQVSISYGQDGKSFTITATNAFGAFNRADNFSGTLLAE